MSLDSGLVHFFFILRKYKVYAWQAEAWSGGAVDQSVGWGQVRGAGMGLDVVRYFSIASRHRVSLDVAGQRAVYLHTSGSIKYRYGKPGHKAEE